MSKTPESEKVTSTQAPTSILVSFLVALGAINFADRAVIGLAGPAIIAEDMKTCSVV